MTSPGSRDSTLASGSDASSRIPSGPASSASLHSNTSSTAKDPPQSSSDDQAPSSQTAPKDSSTLPHMPTTTWIEESLGLLIVVSGIFFGIPVLVIALKYVFWGLIWTLSWAWALLAVTGGWWWETGKGTWNFTTGVGRWIWSWVYSMKGG